MNIPSKLKVGGIIYDVRVVDNEDIVEKAAGQISTERCWMKVLKGNPQFMYQTFWHEIFHAINMELEEETVEFLSQAMYQIIADNPALFKGGEQHGKSKKGK